MKPFNVNASLLSDAAECYTQGPMSGLANSPTSDTELFADAFRASPIGIAVETFEGQPLFVNPAFCSMLGFTEAELRSKHCADFSPPEDAQKDWAFFQQLRAGSIDRYQLDKRYFRKDGSLVWGRLSLSLLNGRPAPLVLAMIEDITEQKHAEDALKEQTALLQSREELLKIFVKYAPAGVAMFDRDMCYVQVSDRWCADYSIDISQVLGHSQYEIFPDTPERWKEMHRRGLEGEALRVDEDCWNRKSGTKWVRWEIRPWWNLDSIPGGILIFAEDITKRKEMEHALSDVARRLVEAQERERARIARDLHDDINQRLALLSMEVSQLEANPSEIGPRGRELRKRIGEIAADVQALAQDLHPSKLEYLGAVAGMKNWCRDFAERQNLKLDFTTNVRNPLPPEVGVVFFRVLQEALQNSVKHSGAKRVRVQLREDSEALHLVVRDSGRGFDIEEAANGRSGLGLTSMRERVRLVNGTIRIESKLMCGTAIHVRVPPGARHDTKQEAV
jgi:PAS domain S-box-containing protein